ncbi:MAG: acyl carrier protein [Gemmataceae bacterium]
MMDRAELIKTLKEILEEERGEPCDDLDETVNLREGLGLDSVDMIGLVMRIQDRFRVVLATEELEKVVVVKDLLDLMQSKMAAAQAA